MPRYWVKTSDTVVFGIPRSASSSRPVSSWFVDCSPYMFNILRCSACCRPSRMWIPFNRFLTIFEVSVPHFYHLHCTRCIVPESLLNHLNSFCGGMLKFNAKSDAGSLFYLLSHFECDDHTAHRLTQWRLPPHWLVPWSCHCSHTHTFQSTLSDCQVTSMLHKPLSGQTLYLA